MIACSTGSPASRSETKFTPLTTRPSFTSRHGMTRTFSMPMDFPLPRRPRQGRYRKQRTARHRFGGDGCGLGQRLGFVEMGERLVELFHCPDAKLLPERRFA